MTENLPAIHEPYKLGEFAKGGTLEFITTGNVAIPLSIKLLQAFVSKKEDDPFPTTAEYVTFCNMIVEQNCNVYLGECWLIRMRGVYKPVIAAQKRVAKAQSMANYGGYEWGWIGKDGTRCPSGPESTLKQTDIDGVWGRIYFMDKKVPFYHEIFRSEYKHERNDRPITMLMKTARDQVHKYAFASEMGNLCTENEIYNDILPAPDCETPKRADRKKVDSKTMDGDEGSASTAAKDGSGADNATVEAMLRGCLNKFQEKFENMHGKEIAKEDALKQFYQICWDTFGGEISQYSDAANFNPDMISKLNEIFDEPITAVESEGDPEDVKSFDELAEEAEAEKEAEQPAMTEEEVDAESDKKFGKQWKFKCLNKKCKQPLFDEAKGTESKPICPTCLRSDIQKAEADSNGL